MQKRASVVGLGTGGYFVGLMPEGRQAAIDLGIAGHLHTRNPPDGGKAWSLDRRGNRAPRRYG